MPHENANQPPPFAALHARVNKIIVQSQTAEHIYQGVCRGLVEEGLADLAWFGWLDERKDAISPLASWGKGADWVAALCADWGGVARSHHPLYRALNVRDWVVYNDVPQHPEWEPFRELFTNGAAQSLALYPIGMERNRRTLLLLAANSPLLYDEDTCTSLRILADIVGLGLTRFPQEEGLPQAQREEDDGRVQTVLAQTVDSAPREAEIPDADSSRLESLHAASLALTQSLDPAVVLQSLLDSLEELVPYDAAMVLIRGLGGTWEPKATRGAVTPERIEAIQSGVFAEIDAVIQERVSEEQQSVILSDELSPAIWRKEPALADVQSWLITPMVAQGNVIGLIQLSRTQPESYDQDSVHIAEALASQAAIALLNAQYYQDARLYTQELQEVAKLSRALRRANTVDDMVPIFLEMVTRDMDAERSVLALVDETEQAAVIRGCYPYQSELLGLQLTLDSGIAKLIVTTGEVYTSTNMHTDQAVQIPRSLRSYFRPVKSCIWLPLQTEEHILGFFQLGFPQEREIAYEERRILTALMEVASVAVTRLQYQETLAQEVRRRTREIQQRQQVSEGLRYILTILNSNRPLEEVLEYIVSQACWLLDTTTGAVHRWNAETESLSVQVTHGLPMGFSVEKNIPLGKEIVMHAIRTRESIATEQFPPAGDTSDTDSEFAAKLAAHYQAMLASPIIISDEVYGCLVLYFPEPHQFSDEDIYLATTFCDQAALAIENARLRTEVEKSAIAAERTRLAQDLHDAVTQNLFSSSIIAEVLPKIWERNPEEGKRRLEEVRRLNKGALAEMRSLLMELRPKGLTEVSLDLLLQHLTEALMSRTQMPIELITEPPGTLPPDVQVSLYRIAQEALNNVAKHAHATKASVQLQVRSNSERGRLELTIQDNGIGFEPDTIAAHHLGLKIMRERAQAINASLRIVSKPGAGTSIIVRWPDKVEESPGSQQIFSPTHSKR